MNFKLTPLILFLILFFVLLLAGIFANRMGFMEEGFISYKQSTAPLSTLTIPQYSSSNTIYKIYDSLYYDSVNGNVLQLFGTPYVAGTTSIDSTGGTITEIDVIPSSGSVVKKFFSSGGSSSSSTTSFVDSSVIGSTNTSTNNSWYYPNSTSYTTQLPYQILNINWGDDSYIHIYDISNATSISSMVLGSSAASNIYVSYTNRNNVPTITNYYAPTDSNNNTFLDTLTYYDSSKNSVVYQVSDYVYFDTTNASLIVKYNNAIDVYDGTVNSDNKPQTKYDNINTAGAITNTSSLVSSNRVTPFLVYNNISQDIILYIPNGQKTMVATLACDPNNTKLLIIKNVVRFNPATTGGIDTSTGITTPTVVTGTTTSSSSTTTDTTTGVTNTELNTLVSSLSTLIQNVNANNVSSTATTPSTATADISSDYILKTQIVPPVCPACPSCPAFPSSISCSSCGNNGTTNNMTKRDASGNIIYNKDPNMLYDYNGNAVRTISNSDTPILNGLGTAANSTGNAIGAVGSGVGNLIGGTIGTVGGVANNIISTTGSIANNLIDGGQSLGSGYGNGNGTAMNRQGTAGYPAGDVQRNLGYGGIGYPATNTQYNTTTFPYYGANPPSTSTFMPVTTDFSAFAK